jgi:glycosyltransferase involved in cell wall biosynthesis
MYRRCIASNRNNAEFDRLIVGSNYVKDQAIASGYLPAQIEVLPYFTELPAEVSAPQDSRMILFMGRIEREKGLSYLLEAVSRMQTSWKLVIAGDGGDLAWAKRRVFELRLTDRTEFVGWVQSEGRSSLFEECSVVAIPSIWPEPFGLVGIEAMSHARPVVAFRVGGIPDWLEDGRTGYAVPPNDVQQMASRLSYLLEHPTVVWEMGRCGRQSVEQRFCSDRHITHLIEILGRAVADAASVGSDGGSVRHVGSSLGSV